LYDRSPRGTTEQAAHGEGILGDRASPCVQARLVAPPGLSRRLVWARRLGLARGLGLACRLGLSGRFVLSRPPACRAVSCWRAVSGWRAAGKRAHTRLGVGLHLARFSRPYGTHVLYTAAYPALKRWATFVASLPGRGRDGPATSASVERYASWPSGWWVARGFRRAEHESSGDSRPPPLKRWGTRRLAMRDTNRRAIGLPRL
jgi:hypothetical protein